MCFVITAQLIYDSKDGFEATDEIREYERLIGCARTPIIGLRPKVNTRSEIDDFIPLLTLPLLKEKILQYGSMGRKAVEKH